MNFYRAQMMFAAFARILKTAFAGMMKRFVVLISLQLNSAQRIFLKSVLIVNGMISVKNKYFYCKPVSFTV